MRLRPWAAFLGAGVEVVREVRVGDVALLELELVMLGLGDALRCGFFSCQQLLTVTARLVHPASLATARRAPRRRLYKYLQACTELPPTFRLTGSFIDLEGAVRLQGISFCILLGLRYGMPPRHPPPCTAGIRRGVTSGSFRPRIYDGQVLPPRRIPIPFQPTCRDGDRSRQRRSGINALHVGISKQHPSRFRGLLRR